MWNYDKDWQPGWTSEPLRIDEILYEYDGPMVFTCRFGTFKVLFSRIDESDNGNLYAVGTVDEKIMDFLKKGNLSLRGALLREPCFIVETKNLIVSKYWECTKSDMPLDLLPTAGRALRGGISDAADTLEQIDCFFSVRFSGGGLSSRTIPFSYFKNLMDNVYESARKIMMPSGFHNAKSATFDFELLEPSFGSLVINIERPLINESNAQRHLRDKFKSINAVYDNSYGKREEFFDELKILVNEAENDSITSYQAEQKIEILKQINGLIPREEAIFTKVEFNANIDNELRQITIDETTAERLGKAHDSALGNFEEVIGKITIINSKQRTFVIERDLGKEVTCSLREDEFTKMQKNSSFKGGSRIKASGKIFQRSRRDYLVADEAELFPDIFA